MNEPEICNLRKLINTIKRVSDADEGNIGSFYYKIYERRYVGGVPTVW
jgi:hypothetical protein